LGLPLEACESSPSTRNDFSPNRYVYFFDPGLSTQNLDLVNPDAVSMECELAGEPLRENSILIGIADEEKRPGWAAS
jgi:hypothetical protein